MLTKEEKAAIKVVARMCGRIGKYTGYDYVDDTIEVRLYECAKEAFEEGLDETGKEVAEKA